MVMHFVLRLVLLFAFAVYENFAAVEGPFDETCPVLYGGECFKIFTPDTAVTADAGELYCQRNLDDLGLHGHLADIHGEDHFRNLASYVRAHDEPLPIILDPNILLGMKYDTAAGTARYRDNTIVTNLYWGERGRPASWGSRLVLRVSTKTSMAKLQNIGNDDTRFKRIMCQYIEK